MITEIWIYCDGPAHPGRRMSVETFHVLGEEAAEYTSHKWGAASNRFEQMLTADNQDAPGLIDGARQRYRLVCRKCKRRPVVLTAENVDKMCDAAADAGIAQLDLSRIGAKL